MAFTRSDVLDAHIERFSSVNTGLRFCPSALRAWRSIVNVASCAKLLDLVLGFALDPRQLVASATLGEDQFVDLNLQRELAAALLVEHHLGEEEAANRHGRGKHGLTAAECPPQYAEREHSELDGRMSYRVGHHG